jgi:hypothetical protein
MEDKETYKIFEELKELGASKEEAYELVNVLNNFSSVKEIERSYTHKRKFLVENYSDNKKFFFFPKFSFASIAILSVILLMGVVSVATASQKSIPGDSLYGVKKLTEKARTVVDPSFQEEVVVRRSEEIKRLSEEKKESELIRKTVTDYENEANALNDKNTEKINESRKNLEEAKENVSAEDKKEIERVLENRNQESSGEVKSLETKSEDKRENERVLNKEYSEMSKPSEVR